MLLTKAWMTYRRRAMKINRQIMIATSLLVLVSGLGLYTDHILPVQAKENSRSTTILGARMPWRAEYIHHRLFPALNVGKYISIALRPFDGYPYISYFNETEGSLMLAWPKSGGNCGATSNWNCWQVHSSGSNTGYYSSIDLWGDSELYWKLGVSYYDATNQSLKLGLITCIDFICDTEDITIDTIGFSGPNTSIKFTPDGTPFVVYFVDSWVDSLRISYPYSGGNCGEGSYANLWQCETIDLGDGVGRFGSVDIGWDSLIHIAYYDQDHGDLKYAYYVGSGGNCGDENKWQCTTIDGADGSDVGRYCSIKAPLQSGAPVRIAYYDETHGYLKFYNSVGGISMVVDDVDISESPMGISLDIDKDGLAVIAYKQIVSQIDPPVLRIARPYLAFGDGAYGNCGDEFGGHQYWRCYTLDNGEENKVEADYASLAISSNGLGMIAYSENDTVFNTTSLKLIYQFSQTFIPLLIK
jgi:hypothetical protein